MMYAPSFQLSTWLLILAVALQTFEYMAIERRRVDRVMLGVLLLMIFIPQMVLPLLFLHLFRLKRWGGIFNGGSDYLTTTVMLGLAIECVPLSHGIGLAYIGVQTLLSYLVAGLGKWRSSDWRSGKALKNLVPALPQPKIFSWLLIFAEIAVPILFFSSWKYELIAVLLLFHLAQVFQFGLNRFFWIWLAAYPSVLFLVKSAKEIF